MLPRLIASGCLLLLSAGAASAQTTDFTDRVLPTVSANEQLVREIRAALPASDLIVVVDRSTTALVTGESLERQLVEAQAIAPDDASRSRIEGVRVHIQAALDALRLAPTETSLGAARGRLDQALGEAVESLEELRPFAQALPAPIVARPAALPEPDVARPAVLPVAGSLGTMHIATLPALGVGLLLFGVALRRRALSGRQISSEGPPVGRLIASADTPSVAVGQTESCTATPMPRARSRW